MNRFVAAVSTGIVAIAASVACVAPLQHQAPAPRVHAPSSSTVDVGTAACVERGPGGEVHECERTMLEYMDTPLLGPTLNLR